MRNQVILGILSEAGGVGKTTLAVNLGYECACRGLSVAILDLDSNHSLEDFVSLPNQPDPEETIVSIFEEKFKGQWNLKTPLELEKFQVCQGHPLMIGVLEKLMGRVRREYFLSKLFNQYPLPHDLIILDCSAGIDLMAFNVLAASTHILIPLDMGVKVKTAARLVQGILLASEELELQPCPKILGLIPNRYNKGAAIHEAFLSELPEIAQALNTKLYLPLRTWQHLNNSAVFGLPLKQLRPNDPVCQVFSAIADDLQSIINQIGE